MSNSTLVSSFGQSDKMGLLCFDIVDMVTYGQSSHWVKKLSLKNVGLKCVMKKCPLRTNKVRQTVQHFDYTSIAQKGRICTKN